MNPIRQRESGESSAAQIRTALFWVAMTLLAALLWRMSTGSSSSKPLPSLSASEFESQLQSRDVQELQVTVYQARAFFSGVDRQSRTEFKAYVAIDEVPKAIHDLEDSGKIVRMRGGVEEDWTSFVYDAIPFVVLLITFVYVLRRQQSKNRESGNLERQQ